MEKYEELHAKTLQEVGMPEFEIAQYTQAHAALTSCLTRFQDNEALESCIHESMQFLLDGVAP
jgi:hypothetical protein